MSEASTEVAIEVATAPELPSLTTTTTSHAPVRP